jgi:hypothetical protein
VWRTFKAQIIIFFPWLPKAHVHLLMQNAFGPRLRLLKVLKVLNVSASLKSPSSKSPFRFNAVSPCKNQKNKLNTSTIQWHRVNIPILKGKTKKLIRRN